ncbi:MBL fold metallo-hydrolase [Haloplanus halobius]|uniref:MBL fold metallo-hydrolase n=1 Tax=Haloplanus halobius TaxID=2934938 RepID=UPI00200C98F9|nr:MBL fold metallo-hydrolase [Haloplanus sp. XH21]
MTKGEDADPDETVESTTPTELKQRIDSGEDVFILDVRSEGDFEEWHIEAENVTIVNYPYFELLDGIPEDLHSELPDDQRSTVLCAKGGSSELVAEYLDEDGYDVDHLARGMNGWARIYEYQELDVDVHESGSGSLANRNAKHSGDVDATIAQYRRPSSGCLAYLIVSDGEAAVIDPLRAFTDEYVQDTRTLGADLTYALDTHVHADHISGIRGLATRTEATAVLPKAATQRGVEYERSCETVTDGDTLAVGDVEIEVISTPGHTTGMTAYKVGNVLFTGDGLLTESVARPDLEDPEAAKDAARTLYESLQEQVLTLPEDTIVAPAHVSDSATPNADGTYTAELGDLIDRMDALAMDEDEFVDFIVADTPPQPANYEGIIAANLGQQAPDDEAAFELELGPNNCAASEEALTN